KLVRNVGGDVLQTIRYEFDPLRAPFLDGDRSRDAFALEALAGWEIIRGFALQGYYRLESFKNGEQISTFRLTLRYEDF
ncbi:MAG TPA: hypothetical protein VEC36_01120, partial [Patescibacteria group bacterium]|nr:hypothetical protein [Patescibacteria group bacterium]